jgi:hypothetical protein
METTAMPMPPMTAAAALPEIHPFTRCDGCLRESIRGAVFTCKGCADYDLCAACHAAGKGVHTHDGENRFVAAAERETCAQCKKDLGTEARMKCQGCSRVYLCGHCSADWFRAHHVRMSEDDCIKHRKKLLCVVNMRSGVVVSELVEKLDDLNRVRAFLDRTQRSLEHLLCNAIDGDELEEAVVGEQGRRVKRPRVEPRASSSSDPTAGE